MRAETALAEVRAFAEREGGLPVQPDKPLRWSRGTLKLGDGNRLALDVNSRERLEILVELLDENGSSPKGRLADDGRPLDAWQKAWPDEHVPALRDMTPREAASDEDGRLLLEGLLRDFEHRAEVNRLRGAGDIDVAALRAELGV